MLIFQQALYVDADLVKFELMVSIFYWWSLPLVFQNVILLTA